MRVILRAAVLTLPEHQARLPGLLDFALEGRHDVLIDPDARSAWDLWLGARAEDSAVYIRAEQDSQKRQAISPSDVEVVVDDHPVSYAGNLAALGKGLGRDVYEAFQSADEETLRDEGVHDEFLPIFNTIFRLV